MIRVTVGALVLACASIVSRAQTNTDRCPTGNRPICNNSRSTNCDGAVPQLDCANDFAMKGAVTAGTSNSVTFGGAAGTCAGKYAKTNGKGCGTPFGNQF